jgi:small subunit ribosomal protein S16
MVRIRLARMGRKGRPFYRVVAADSRAPRDGKFIEILGTYNPMTKKDEAPLLDFNLERIDYWISHGAQPSDTVAGLIVRVRGAKTSDEEAVGEKAE